jgi:hypothetical protein
MPLDICNRMLSYTVTYPRKQFADHWSAVPGGRNYPSRQFPNTDKDVCQITSITCICQIYPVHQVNEKGGRAELGIDAVLRNHVATRNCRGSIRISLGLLNGCQNQQQQDTADDGGRSTNERGFPVGRHAED